MYSSILELQPSRNTLLTTPLSLHPNIKTYVKLELCIRTEYVLLKIRLCIVFKQQNFTTVHHFKSLGFLFVLKLKKKRFSSFSLHCFNWTKDYQASLILLSINMSSILSLSNCSSLSQPSYQHLFNLSLPCNSEIVLDHQSTIFVNLSTLSQPFLPVISKLNTSCSLLIVSITAWA